MIKKIYHGFIQRFAQPSLSREAELNSVMLDEQQVREYTRDGEDGSLAILYQLIIYSVSRIAAPHGDALDICCGSGSLLCLLAKAMPDVRFTGLDLSEQMLKFAAEKQQAMQLSNLNFTPGNMMTLVSAFPNRQFDLITWNFALHHCSDEDMVLEILNQIPKLLKPNGTFFIFDINRPKTITSAKWLADTFNRSQGDWFYQDSLNSYKAAFSYKELADILSRTELKNYRHVEPLFWNFFQIVTNSAGDQTARRPKPSHLTQIWQKAEYYSLRATFAWRLP